jgi:hypothetical protein
MSYSKFLDDLNSFYKDSCHKNVHCEIAWGIVRDERIKKGNLEALILFTLENWDLGNCDDFIPPLENHLFQTNNLELYKKLWKGIIKIRLNRLNDDFGRERKEFLLKGIIRFKKGLEHFNDLAEIEKLDKITSSISRLKKTTYPA